MKKYGQYSLLSLFGVMLLIATGMAIWCWDADQERIRAAEQWNQVVQSWNQKVDRFEKEYAKYQQSKAELEILVRLMRQNPQHELWKENEYQRILRTEEDLNLSFYNFAWPRQTIQLGSESIHVMTSNNPCISNRLVVHADANGRILDVQRLWNIYAFDQLNMTLKATKHPLVVRFAWRESTPNFVDLAFLKSRAMNIDPLSIQIIDRQKEYLNAMNQAGNP